MMVRCMKDDSKGKSEEELAELFRMFDRFGPLQQPELKTDTGSNLNRFNTWTAVCVCVCRNEDGYIDLEELKMMLEETGESITEDDIEELMKDGDTNNDGRIDYDGKSECVRVRELL